MICWYCYWGWPDATKAVYDKALALLDGDSLLLEYGPGHIVWGDENFEEDNIQWCLDNASANRGALTDEQFAIVVTALQELLAVPEEIRCCCPADYDDEHPENFPPDPSLGCNRSHGK